VNRRVIGWGAGLDALAKSIGHHRVNEEGGVAFCCSFWVEGARPEYMVFIEVTEDCEGVVFRKRVDGSEVLIKRGDAVVCIGAIVN
jgi:hypothetical protein